MSKETTRQPINVIDNDKVSVGNLPTGTNCCGFSLDVTYNRNGRYFTTRLTLSFNIDVRLSQHHHHVYDEIEESGLSELGEITRIELRN